MLCLLARGLPLFVNGAYDDGRNLIWIEKDHAFSVIGVPKGDVRAYTALLSALNYLLHSEADRALHVNNVDEYLGHLTLASYVASMILAAWSADLPLISSVPSLASASCQVKHNICGPTDFLYYGFVLPPIDAKQRKEKGLRLLSPEGCRYRF